MIEVFAAGCPCCDEAVRQIRDAACPSCDVQVRDMRSDHAAQAQAKRYGITRVPAVAINGQLAECCSTGAVDLATLRRLGLGVA
jgi:glutaredoxin 3